MTNSQIPSTSIKKVSDSHILIGESRPDEIKLSLIQAHNK